MYLGPVGRGWTGLDSTGGTSQVAAGGKASLAVTIVAASRRKATFARVRMNVRADWH
jgi:hypothetical protein